LPAVAFVNFLQTHDQVGNRALGERLAATADPYALRLAVCCLLLAPAVPLIFMGEEFAASAPFRFFCDFAPDLAAAVRDGRRSEFSAFAQFADPAAHASIPDPGAEAEFGASKLDWRETALEGHAEWHTLYSDLLQLRRRCIAPHLPGKEHRGAFALEGDAALAVDWILGDGASLSLRANFSARNGVAVPPAAGERIHALGGETAPGKLDAWSAHWFLGTHDG
jgi:1,4-alpha-glucan branching enzyme